MCNALLNDHLGNVLDLRLCESGLRVLTPTVIMPIHLGYEGRIA